MLPKSISVVPSIISMIVISDRELYQDVSDQQVFFYDFPNFSKNHLLKANYLLKAIYPYGKSSSPKKQIKWEAKYIKQSTTLSSQLYLAASELFNNGSHWRKPDTESSFLRSFHRRSWKGGKCCETNWKYSFQFCSIQVAAKVVTTLPASLAKKILGVL